MAGPEAEIQKLILEWLKVRRTFHWRVGLGGLKIGKGGRRANPMTGFPDIQGVLGGGAGRMFVIEVKAPGEHPTTKQLEWLRDLHAAGVVCVVARSLHDAIEALCAPGGPVSAGWPIN